MLDQVLKTIDSRKHQAVSALKEFLTIPSISTKPEHKPDMLRCAQWLADQLTFGGLDVKVMPTAGHPVVVAKNKHIAGRPTVLLYGHYDVQPVEPLEQWISPPFEPTVRGDAIFARGAVDDKGQVWAHVEAILAWQAHSGLPINLIALIEGEEEIGSEHLADFLKKHKDSLKADIAVISDTNQFDKGLPAICYGLRGLVYMEVTITGPDHDLHSGLYGGAVGNPANVLCELLGSLHDQEGRINIPGFYDDVIPLTADEKNVGEPPLRRKSLHQGTPRPIPLRRSRIHHHRAKLGPAHLRHQRPHRRLPGPRRQDCHRSPRIGKSFHALVPNQNPAAIRDAFTKALKDRCPKSVTIEVTCHSHTAAVLTPMHSPAMELAREALKEGFGIDPVLVRGGGSVPVVSMIKSVLGIDTLMVGFGLPDDRVHSPNEKFDLEALYAGSRTAAALYDRLSRLHGVH